MKLVRLTDFSGDECSIYSIIDDGGTARFQKFINEWIDDYENEMLNITGRIKSIGKIGADEDFFKLEEWKKDERVCCLHDDPDKALRLFAIRFENEKIVVLGGGGPKPKDIRAWQDDKKLTGEAEFIIEISNAIRKKMELGMLYYSEDGLKLKGDLNIP